MNPIELKERYIATACVTGLLLVLAIAVDWPFIRWPAVFVSGFYFAFTLMRVERYLEHVFQVPDDGEGKA